MRFNHEASHNTDCHPPDPVVKIINSRWILAEPDS